MKVIKKWSKKEIHHMTLKEFVNAWHSDVCLSSDSYKYNHFCCPVGLTDVSWICPNSKCFPTKWLQMDQFDSYETKPWPELSPSLTVSYATSIHLTLHLPATIGPVCLFVHGSPVLCIVLLLLICPLGSWWNKRRRTLNSQSISMIK